MIISRTPLRMSFVGGGSDLPSFYKRFGGAVISTAIDKYIYVTCNPKFDSGIRVAYSKTEEVTSLQQIEHRVVKAALTLREIKGGIEITTVADIPSRGTGLGSSSSFTVGLLNILYAFQGRQVSSATLAEESCRVEIDLCGEPIGKQDQYAAAFGGFNLIEFHPSGNVDVTPMIIPEDKRKSLAQRIIVLYTGITRDASVILKAQSESCANDRTKQCALQRMVELTYSLRTELQSGNIDSFGEILHENWELKKSLTSGISTPDIDEWYEIARSNGARGGKLLGAGAGGFLIFYAMEEDHNSIVASLSHLKRVKLGFERLGSRIIFYNPPDQKQY